MHRWGGEAAFPAIITIFSAPNYPRENPNNYGNKGAVVTLDGGRMGIKQYKAVDNPYMLPDNIDLFEWSLPFVFQKTQEILDGINKRAIATQTMKSKNLSKKDFDKMFDAELHKRFNKWSYLRAQIRCYARFLRILHILRSNQAHIEKIKKLHNGKLPYFSLIGAASSDSANLMNFYVKKYHDQVLMGGDSFPVSGGKLSESTLKRLQGGK